MLIVLPLTQHGSTLKEQRRTMLGYFRSPSGTLHTPNVPKKKMGLRIAGLGFELSLNSYRSSTGWVSLNVKALSACSTMSLLPVNAAPAVPAPAPAAAPMAAPLPPPANAPIRAPAPAPPPMNPTDLLPLPLSERATDVVSIWCSRPLMVTESSRTWRRAPPLKCPMPLASTTVPRAATPCSITVFPSTTTGCATVAEKPCPDWLFFELSVSPKRTTITVPEGMSVTSAVAGFFPLSSDTPAPEPPGCALLVVVAG